MYAHLVPILRSKRIWLVMILLAIVTACNILPTTEPTIVILSPPSASVFHEGDEIVVLSNVLGAHHFVRVELVVDDQVVRADTATAPGRVSFPLTQVWRATVGTHVILIRAFDAAGKPSSPVGVSVTIQPAVPTATATLATTPVLPTVIPTATVAACVDNAVFVADVTVPDGTLLAPAQTFNKIWRVRNTGCPWSAGYQLVHVGGEAMSATRIFALPETATGATADLLVPMTAPTVPGLHNGTWRLRNPRGVIFGTTVTVVVNVLGTQSPTNTVPPTACSGVPQIASFSAVKRLIAPLEAATLTWTVTNAESIEIDQGVGFVGVSGSINVAPLGTTTYTMSARCGSEYAYAQVRIVMPFAVTRAVASADPLDYTGACPKSVSISADIIATDAGTVTYRWESNDGSKDGATFNIGFGGAGMQTVTTSWNLGSAGKTFENYWVRIHVLSPTDVTSNNATFTLRCN